MDKNKNYQKEVVSKNGHNLFFSILYNQYIMTTKAIDGVIYSWKAIGYSNWLEKRSSVADVLGLAVLPKGLPDWIDLPDDVDN